MIQCSLSESNSRYTAQVRCAIISVSRTLSMLSQRSPEFEFVMCGPGLERAPQTRRHRLKHHSCQMTAVGRCANGLWVMGCARKTLEPVKDRRSLTDGSGQIGSYTDRPSSVQSPHPSRFRGTLVVEHLAILTRTSVSRQTTASAERLLSKMLLDET